MTREQLIQAVRAVLKAALSITDEQVIPEHDDGPRPALPYLQVRATVFGTPVGSEEITTSALGAKSTGERLATITLAGFGVGAEEWLGTLVGALPLPSVQDSLAAQGITLRPLGGVRDLSAIRDTSFEAMFVQEFQAGWVRSSVAESADEVASVQVDVTYPREPGESSPPALSDTVTVTL